MPIFFLFLPVITVLALILAWRTRGTERRLSVAIAALSSISIAWYFMALFALEMS